MTVIDMYNKFFRYRGSFNINHSKTGAFKNNLNKTHDRLYIHSLFLINILKIKYFVRRVNIDYIYEEKLITDNITLNINYHIHQTSHLLLVDSKEVAFRPNSSLLFWCRNQNESNIKTLNFMIDINVFMNFYTNYK